MVYIRRSPSLDRYLKSIRYSSGMEEKDFLSREAFLYAQQFVSYKDLKPYLEIKNLSSKDLPFDNQDIVFTQVYQSKLAQLNVVNG